MPIREHRHGRVHELLGLEQFLYRRQLVHRPKRSGSRHRLERPAFWASLPASDGPEVSAGDGVVHCGQGLRARATSIAYNYVANFHDGIDIETYGNPDGSAAVDGPKYPPKEYWDERPVSIDFYNNYMTNFHDNPFETDGGMHNIRVLRNMMINSASHAFCNQPSNRRSDLLDGKHRLSPARRIDATDQRVGRRALLPQHDPLGDSRRKARRTSIGETICFLARMRRPQYSASTRSRTTRRRTTTDSVPTRRPSAFQWTVPAPACRGLHGSGHAPRSRRRNSRRLASTAPATDQDQHSVLRRLRHLHERAAARAQDDRTIQKVYKAEDFDFRLKPNSVAVDAAWCFRT